MLTTGRAADSLHFEGYIWQELQELPLFQEGQAALPHKRRQRKSSILPMNTRFTILFHSVKPLQRFFVGPRHDISIHTAQGCSHRPSGSRAKSHKLRFWSTGPHRWLVGPSPFQEQELPPHHPSSPPCSPMFYSWCRGACEATTLLYAFQGPSFIHHCLVVFCSTWRVKVSAIFNIAGITSSSFRTLRPCITTFSARRSWQVTVLSASRVKLVVSLCGVGWWAGPAMFAMPGIPFHIASPHTSLSSPSSINIWHNKFMNPSVIDVHWCSLVFSDIQRCSLMFIDVHWYSLILIDGHWCSLMFIDIHWCSLMFIDVHWYSLMFIDVHWCSLMFIDIRWCSLMFIDVSSLVFSDVQRCSLMFIDVHWYSLMLIDGHWCSLMFIDIHWCSLMSIDVHWCSLMFIDVHWCSLMFVDVHWCSLVFSDIPWCSLMFIDFHWCSLMFIDVHWCSLIFVDVHWCSLMFIGIQWCSAMFIDVHWCSLIFIDFNWWSLMFIIFIDIHWYSLMFIDLHWFSWMVIDVHWCSLIYLIFIDIQWYSLMFIDVLWCSLVMIDIHAKWFVDIRWSSLIFIDTCPSNHEWRMIIPFSAVVLKQKLCKVKHCQLSRWPHFKQNALVRICDQLSHLCNSWRANAMHDTRVNPCLPEITTWIGQKHCCDHGLNVCVCLCLCACVCARARASAGACACACAFVSRSFVDPV